MVPMYSSGNLEEQNPMVPKYSTGILAVRTLVGENIVELAPVS